MINLLPYKTTRLHQLRALGTSMVLLAYSTMSGDASSNPNSAKCRLAESDTLVVVAATLGYVVTKDTLSVASGNISYAVPEDILEIRSYPLEPIHHIISCQSPRYKKVIYATQLDIAGWGDYG